MTTRNGPRPDLRLERALLRSGARVVVGMDEVGRGALAGPVTVGAVAVDLSTRTCPQGVADSKLLTPAARERLLPAISRWGLARATGHAGPDEIDRYGIVAALRLAGRRALGALGIPVDLVLLDGSHDWLTAPAELDLFGAEGPDLAAGGDLAPAADPAAGAVPVGGTPAADGADPWSRIAVRTRVKADQRCASVAAASVLAKCRRDALMVELSREHPAYGWHENKGYGSAEHVGALRRLGPSTLHRTSWRLPVGPDDAAPSADDERTAGPRGWAMMDA
ncbi:ribonuclease HII [Actinotalea ferrariae CF5-4]|uniref:Ribonuclease n=1 Tax=Actinotalea ferrariae CF5-4 TaxID=948458 RepID=A0A021VP23_9CELL|nr:ribonuclease HII [Actinotalea ferrariae]EYR62934.1 ribonuclease HII [Actinotalea ferrariae CF5-4]